MADPDDSNGDGVSGRLGRGKFGWKASRMTLEEAVSAAFLTELGLGTPMFPDRGQPNPVEVSSGQVRAVVRFVEAMPLLPRPASANQDNKEGSRLFRDAGCAACHTPVYEISAMNGRPPVHIEPYTDLLLHDMGPALADGISEGNATGSEFRTPPLWRVAANGPPYLHDGRAKSLDEAVRMHGGEARRSAAAHAALPESKRRTLVKFLNSL